MSTTTTTMTHLKYAIFPDPAHARAARNDVDAAIEGDVELLTSEADLDHEDVPLTMTMARMGTALGVSLVAGLMLAAVLGLAWIATDSLPGDVPAPWATMAIVVLFAAILGGLAGALSYATRNRGELRRLRKLLHEGNSVILIECEHELGDFLRRRGAVATGSLA